jgi:hypothetical protein
MNENSEISCHLLAAPVEPGAYNVTRTAPVFLLQNATQSQLGPNFCLNFKIIAANFKAQIVKTRTKICLNIVYYDVSTDQAAIIK